MNCDPIIKEELSKLIRSKDKLSKLILYADDILNRLNISGRAITGEDVVYDLIAKLAASKRAWNKNKQSNLYAHIYYLITSYCYNILKKEKYFIKPAVDIANEDEYDDSFSEFVDSQAQISLDDFVTLMESENAEEILMNKFNTNDEHALIAMGLQRGMTRVDIAIDLGISIRRIAKDIKIMREKLNKVRREILFYE